MKVLMITHGVFLAVWLTVACSFALGVATLGNEGTLLSMHRGDSVQQRDELLRQQDILRSRLQSEARRDRLEVAVRRLGLPLQPHRQPHGTDEIVEVARTQRHREGAVQ